MSPLCRQRQRVARTGKQVGQHVAALRGWDLHLLRLAVSGHVRQPVAADLGLGFLPGDGERRLRGADRSEVSGGVEV